MKRILLAVSFLFGAWIAGGQDDRQTGQRREPPKVQADRQQEMDADFSQLPSGKPAADLILELGDSIYPITQKIPGSLAYFEVRLDRELIRNGVDAPRYDILQNAVAAGKTAGEGYRTLVQEAMSPLARAAPTVDQIFPKLEPQVQQNAQLAQTLLALVKNQQQGQAADPETLQALEQQAAKVANAVEDLRQPDQQAYTTAQAARTGLQAAEGARMRLMSTGPGTIAEARRLDEFSLRGATRNSASGRALPDSMSTEGRSGPVLEMVARRLEAAQKRTGLALMWTSKMTEPQMGYIAIVFKLAKDVDDLVKQASQEARRSDPNAARHAQEAQDLSTATTLTFMKVRDGWGQIKEKALGKEVEDGEDGIVQKLPAPLPQAPLQAQAPKRTSDLYDALNSKRMAEQKDQKGQPIRFPDELKKDTQTIMRRQGIADGNYSCAEGGC